VNPVNPLGTKQPRFFLFLFRFISHTLLPKSAILCVGYSINTNSPLPVVTWKRVFGFQIARGKAFLFIQAGANQANR
jgi:hypothetical protein